MALFTAVTQRFPVNGAEDVSINTKIKSRFAAFYIGEGPIIEMVVTAGHASLSGDGNTGWADLPQNQIGETDNSCFTPTLTLEYSTVYTWTAHGTVYTDQPAHGGPFITNVSSSEFTFTTEATPNRQINLSSPTDTDTEIVLEPLLQWTIDGGGAEAGDLLDIYLRKDDSNFTGDDLLAGLVDATLNSDLQIVGGLTYNSTYYWQVQAANSTAGDLVSSSIFSFTTLVFAPPAVSVDGSSNPTGLNNMVTLKRIVVAAANKIFYET